MNSKAQEIQRLRRQVISLVEVVGFYADPETYNAVMFMADRPCGDFMNDFGNNAKYDRPMPGKKARSLLNRMAAAAERREATRA